MALPVPNVGIIVFPPMPCSPYSSKQEPENVRSQRARWIIHIVMIIGVSLPLLLYYLLK